MTKLYQNKPEGWQSLFDAIDQFDWSDLPSLVEIRAWRTAFRAEIDRLRAAGGNHDLDFLLWCLEPAKPVRVYSQVNYGVLQEQIGSTSEARIPDTQWITVTLDSGMSFVVGGGWSLPPGYPNFSTTWIEMVGTEGAILLDDSHKDIVLNTMKGGMQLPLSTMPGEYVEHTYAGAMAPETVHFLEACVFDRPVLVTPEHARMVMEVYIAADLSAERNLPVDLPLKPSKGKSLEKAA